MRLLLAEADLPLATMGERLVTADAVVKGRTKAAQVHPELAASWPGGASWPPAPEVAADRIRVRRIRRLAAILLFVAGLIDLLSSSRRRCASTCISSRSTCPSPSSRRPER